MDRGCDARREFPAGQGGRKSGTKNGRGYSYSVGRSGHRGDRIFRARIAERERAVGEGDHGGRCAIGSGHGAEARRRRTLHTNEILQSILSNMGDAVIVADKEGKFLVFNPAAERMFGKGATQTASSEWSHHYGLYLPDKVTPFPPDQLPLTRSIRGEEVNNVEIFVRHAKRPHGLWTRVNGRPLRDASGELSGGVIVCRDITEIKKEEFFLFDQSRVLEMIAADASLPEILTNLVLLMEAQAQGMLCSILVLSGTGHVRHGAAPSLPEAYVKAGQRRADWTA